MHRWSHPRRAGAHPALYLDLQEAGVASVDLEEALVSSACNNGPTLRFLTCEGTAPAYESNARAVGTEPYSGEWWRRLHCAPAHPPVPACSIATFACGACRASRVQGARSAPGPHLNARGARALPAAKARWGYRSAALGRYVGSSLGPALASRLQCATCHTPL